MDRNAPPAGLPRLPLWGRWALALGVAAALAIALVVFVDNHNSDSLAPESPTAAVRANKEAEIVVAQDQAPRVAVLDTAAVKGRPAFTRVIRADVRNRIASGQIQGPLRRVSCRSAGSSAGRSGFRCVVTAGGVNYAFVGVVDAATRQATYCKRDPPPVPSQNIPLSRRCTI